MANAVMPDTEQAVNNPRGKGLRVSTIVKWVAILLVLTALAVGGSNYLSYTAVR